MRRVELIDGLRGYFLVSMLLTHMTFTGGYALLKVNHAELGFVQDAQGFVFLSGLLVGAIYARRMEHGGFRAAAAKMWRRAFEIYLTMLACLVAVLALARILPGAPEAWTQQLERLLEPGVAAKVAALLMFYQAGFFDILPQYVIYLAVAPPLLWLCLRGKGTAVVAGAFAVWLGVQLGLDRPLVAALDGLLASWQDGLSTRTMFNPLGWQLAFFAAMPIGVAWSRRRLDLSAWFDPRGRAPVLAALAVVLFFMAWRLAFTFGLVPGGVAFWFRVFENRPEFSLVFLANFVALAYLVTWVVVAGERSGSRLAAVSASALRRLFNLSFLRLLGRHSLQVYAWHVILVYLVIYLDQVAGPFGEPAKTAIALSAVLLLALPALAIERYRAAGERRTAERVAQET